MADIWLCDLLVTRRGKRTKCENAAFMVSPDGFRLCSLCKQLIEVEPDCITIPSMRLEDWTGRRRMKLFEVFNGVDHDGFVHTFHYLGAIADQAEEVSA